MVKLEVDFEIFSTLAFYSTILLGKLLVMQLLVSRTRLSRKVFANPEDKAFVRGGEASVKTSDPDVERFRRAHLNDLENILPFFPLACIFCFSSPDPDFAKCLFQLFTLARISHTVFYTVPKLRKAWPRFISCFIGWIINLYMVYAILVSNI